MDVEPKKKGLRLWRRGHVPLPTWRGWLAVLVLGALAAWGALHAAYPFLAVNAPNNSPVMVIEGWIPDYCLRDAVELYRRRHCRLLVLTGGPLENGSLLADYQTYPQLAAAVLKDLGMPTNELVVVPCPRVVRDRTYESAVALEKWWRVHEQTTPCFNLVSMGPHARRSRLIFEKAMGSDAEVGVFALPHHDFDPRRWWRSSEGFRVVTGEAIAYFYARFLFRRPAQLGPSSLPNRLSSGQIIATAMTTRMVPTPPDTTAISGVVR